MKNKLLGIFVCMLLITSVLAIVLTAEEGSYIKEKIESIVFSEPNIQQQEEYLSLNVEEASSCLMKPGEPVLPVYTKIFKFPFGTKIEGVECIPSQIHQKDIFGEIEPSPMPVPLVPMDKSVEKKVVEDLVVKDDTVYNSMDFFPYGWYDYRVGCGLDDSRHVVFLTVRFYPVRYSPGQNMIQYANKVDIKVKYYGPTQPAIFTDEYDMVVIAPSEFSDDLQPLVEYKNDSSIPTKLVTLNDIYTGKYFPAQGRDDQEKIKYFIKNAIEEWNITYALLAGGENKVPVRMSYVQDGGYEISIISDLYYADIYKEYGGFCSWDSNGNDIFGEYNYQGRTDIVDLYPDVHLGRLNLRDINEVSGVINKIITYESTGAYMEDWFKNIITCGGDTFDDGAGYCEGEEINQEVINLLNDFNPEKIWATNGKLIIVPNIVNAVENGSGFLYFSGHGTYQNWATHPKDDFQNWIPIPVGYTFLHAEQLNNGEMLPITYIGGCSNCKFSDNVCFGWSFVKNPDGGSIATYGYTALGFGYPGPTYLFGLVGGMELSFFKAYKINNAGTAGELYSAALNNYLNNYWVGGAYDCKTVEELEPFCDPSLRIAEVSEKPNKPDTPDGPTSGDVGIEYTYNASTTDPDGDLIKYCFDWGDGTVTWTDWIESGEIASLNHMWEKPDDYEIKVKARDENGLDSEWSEPLLITISVDAAFLNIERIRGGLGKVNVVIKNIGTLEASDVNCNISVVGGMLGLIDISTEKTIETLGVEEEEKVNTNGIIFGFGKIDITVTVSAPSANTDTKTSTGFVLGPFVLAL